MAGSKQQAAQAVFGSVYGKHQAKSDQQIMREIARLEQQHLARAAKSAKDTNVSQTPNGPAGGSNVPAYHRYP